MKKSISSNIMPILYGIKLWSINHDLFHEAAKRFSDKEFDFIELYTVPGKVDLKALEPISHIPFTIHAPHENHDFNVFTLTQKTVEMYRRDVLETADALNASHIVVHGGVGDSVEQYVKNFAQIDDPRIIIENMPKRALDGATCFAYSLDQLHKIHDVLDKRYCIDIGHAIKSSISQGVDDYKRFLLDILEAFRPQYFHVSNGNIADDRDEHLSLLLNSEGQVPGHGLYDIQWIANQIAHKSEDENIYVVFEVPKQGATLQEDIDNIEFFKNQIR